MRILVLSWRDPKHPLAGGAEQVMHQHMLGWIEAGHEVTLFSSLTRGLKEKERLDGVEIIRAGYQYGGVQLKGLLYYLQHKENFDFIVDQFHGLPFFTPLYVFKPKLAVIQETAREVWFLNHFFWPLNWLVGLIGFCLEPLLFLLYEEVPFMTGSASAKEDVAEYGIPKRNISIVPHGVILETPKELPEKEEKKTLIYLGVLTKDKGVEDAVEAFRILKEKGDYRLFVVGKHEDEKYLTKIKRRIGKYGLKKKVEFFGKVSNRKKFELLAKSHLLINPSKREGWGLVNIEANAVGTPVIAYPSRGLVDSVKDGVSGIIVEKKRPSLLAEAVGSLFKDKRRYNRLVVSAQDWSNRFNWKKSKQLSLKLIERIYGK